MFNIVVLLQVKFLAMSYTTTKVLLFSTYMAIRLYFNLKFLIQVCQVYAGLGAGSHTSMSSLNFLAVWNSNFFYLLVMNIGMELLVKMEIRKMQTTNFFMFAECISGAERRRPVCVLLNRIFPFQKQNMWEAAESFPTQCCSWLAAQNASV